MYALLLLLTTVVSCILLAPGLHDKLKSVPFCKDGDDVGSEGGGNFIDSLTTGLTDKISGGIDGYKFNCSEAVGYLAVYRYAQNYLYIVSRPVCISWKTGFLEKFECFHILRIK